MKTERIENNPLSGSRIPSLDGLRALSITMVLIDHATVDYAAASGHPVITAILGVVGDGNLGVFIFFVISGLLITTLLLKEERQTGRISLKHFYIRRVFRIFPAYYSYLAAVAILTACGVITVRAADFLHACTFSYIYYFGPWNWYVAHTWSLSVEEQFYLLWPLLLILLGRKRAVWWGVSIILLCPFVRVAADALGHGVLRRICFTVGVARYDVLMMGCLPAILWPSARFQQFLQSLFRWRLHYVAMIGALLVTSPLLFTLLSWDRYQAIQTSIEGLGAALLVYWCVTHTEGPVGRFLNARMVRHLGVISYSIYLWQQLFLTHNPHIVTNNIPADIVLVLIVAHLSYYLIEQPFLRLRVRSFGRATPRAASL